jgi:hypothetical protein
MPSKPYPHPEERLKGASRRTQARYAALVTFLAQPLGLTYPTSILQVKGVESSECI